MGRIATLLRALCLKRSKAVEPREYGDPYLAEEVRAALSPDICRFGCGCGVHGDVIHIPYGATPRKLVGREGG